MELTILGCAGGGVPRPGGAASGYLVRSGKTRLLVDCGNGILGNLSRHVRYEDLDAIYLSHMHFDHCLDLFPLLLARARFGPTPIYAPPGAQEKLESLFRLFSSHPDLYINGMNLREHVPGQEIQLGDLTLRSLEVVHNAPSFALRLEDSDGSLAYSSDTGPCPALIRIAEDADLFLCEASFQENDAMKAYRNVHLTAKEAGGFAKNARSKRLVLTHLLHSLDQDLSRKEAEGAFSGAVEVAQEGKSLTV